MSDPRLRGPRGLAQGWGLGDRDFHTGAEVRDELQDVGLEVVAVYGVEGPGWVAADFEERWARPEGREAVLDTARACEDVDELQVLSAHYLAVARPS